MRHMCLNNFTELSCYPDIYTDDQNLYHKEQQITLKSKTRSVSTSCCSSVWNKRGRINCYCEVSHFTAVAVCSSALVISCQHRPSLSVIGLNHKRQHRSVLWNGHVHTSGLADNWTATADSVPADSYRSTIVTSRGAMEWCIRFIIRKMNALWLADYLCTHCNNVHTHTYINTYPKSQMLLYVFAVPSYMLYF